MKETTSKPSLKKLAVLAALVLCLVLTSFPAFAGNIATDADVTMTPGPIEVTQVPSFNFKPYLKDYDQGATPPMVDSSPEGYILVEDARGTGKSWTIKATMGELITKEKRGAILPNAVLFLPAITFEPVETVGTPFKGYPARLRAGDEVYHTVAISPPSVKGGLWKGTFDQAQLIPVGFTAKLHEYKAVMHWSIEDTP